MSPEPPNKIWENVFMDERDIGTIVKVATAFTTIYSIAKLVDKTGLHPTTRFAIGFGAGYTIGNAILTTDSQKVVDDGLWPSIYKRYFKKG